MVLTIDCGEGRHDACVGESDRHYLIPQANGERFVCSCPCHRVEGEQSIADAVGVDPYVRDGDPAINPHRSGVDRRGVRVEGETR